MSDTSTSPRRAAATGILLVLPLLTLNAVVGHRIEPFFSLIRPGLHTSPREYVLLTIVVLLLPVGALLAVGPMLRPRADGRRLYLVNGVVAAFLLIAFAAVAIGLGADIYRCDVLQIPNCD